MKEIKRGARRSSQTCGVVRLSRVCGARMARAAARVLLVFSFAFQLFSFDAARAQTTATPNSTGQDQRGIGLKPDAQQKQATPAPAQPRGERPELVLQTGYAVMAATGSRFSPDGRLLATYSGMFSGQVKLWDVSTGHELRTLAADAGGTSFGMGGVRSVAFSRDGRLFAAGSDDGSTKVWDVATGRELYKLGGDARGAGDSAIYSVAFGADDHVLVTLGGEPTAARFWDLTTGQLARETEGVTMPGGALYGTSGLTVTPDGSQVLLIQGDAIKFVEIATGREARSVEVPSLKTQTPSVARSYIRGLGIPGLKSKAPSAEEYLEKQRLRAINALTFTPDGRLLSADIESFMDAGAWHYNIKLHDLTAQKEYQLFDLPQMTYASMTFSPDGRLLVTTVGNHVRLWDTTTGAEARTIDVPALPSRLIPDSYVWSAAFSPDSRVLATTDSDTQITLWDAATGRALRSLAGHVNYTYEAAFSADGTRLLTGGKTVWDVATGRGLRASAVDSPAALAQFSRDGKLIAERALTGSNSVALYDAQSHKLLHALAPAEQADVNQVVFSPDGRFVATSYRLNQEQTMARAREAQQKALTASKIDPKEQMKEMTRINEEAEKEAKEEAKKAKNNPHAYQDAYQRIWAQMNAQQEAEREKSLAPTAGLESQVKIWDTATGTEARTLAVPPANPFATTVDHIAFSGDGRTLAASTFGANSVKLFDVTTGQQVGELSLTPAPGAQGPSAALISGAGNDERITSIGFNPDGRLVAVADVRKENSFDYSALVAAARAQGRKMPTFDPKQVAKQIMEGQHAVSTVKIFNAQGGQEVLSLNLGANEAKALAFSADSHTLAAASADGAIKLFDAGSGTELRTLAGEGESINSLAFSPDGGLLASTSNEGSTALWDAKTGARLATLISVGDGGDWLVVTPDGLFDGSPGAWDQILWRFGGNTFNVEPVETFFNEFFYPGLLSDLAAGKRPVAPRDIALIDRRQPSVALKAGAGGTVSTRTIDVSVEVKDAPAGAKDVRLFRNGSLVKVWHGDVLKGQPSATLEATVPVVAGENRFTAYAFNNENVKSHDAELDITGADSLKREGTAYVLAVGVNSYENPQYNLKYAAADAQDFADQVSRHEAQLGRYAQVVVVPLIDSDATKANILAALKILAGDTSALPANAPKSLAQLKPAQPEDTVAVYFAGHGTAQKNRFYLIPHDMAYAGGRDELDAAGLKTILAHSISDEELQSAVEGLDAGQLLLVIDACNSGQALEAEEKRRGPMNSKGLAQLAYEKGMYILTAAQSYQAALEASQLGHGLLTYALVEEGLKSMAADDEPKDGVLQAREWLDFATARVPEMQLEKMRQARSLNLTLSFAEGDDVKAGPERRNLQRPRAFYRRELGSNPLVLARNP
jgi:WD40 repeat protein